MPFVDAVRENVWLRMLIMGPTGAGKTAGALEIASKLYDGTLPIFGIDTEHDRMRLYADRYRFKHSSLTDHAPETFEREIGEAARAGAGGILIIDSASHEWMGTNGVLQQADRFGDWKNVRPKHNAFVETILSTPMHVIVCVRSKMKYEVQEYEDGGRTRQRISKLGLGPIQDDTFPYEFDVVASLDVGTHEATFSNRCSPLVDQSFPLIPGDEVAGILTKWLSGGDPLEIPEAATDEQVKELRESLLSEGIDQDRIDAGFAEQRRTDRGVLSPAYVDEQLRKSKSRLAARNTKKDDKAKGGQAAPAQETIPA